MERGLHRHWRLLSHDVGTGSGDGNVHVVRYDAYHHYLVTVAHNRNYRIERTGSDDGEGSANDRYRHTDWFSQLLRQRSFGGERDAEQWHRNLQLQSQRPRGWKLFHHGAIWWRHEF